MIHEKIQLSGSVSSIASATPHRLFNAQLNQTPIRVALGGGFLPRRCGIATFTADVFASLKSAFPTAKIDVYAMSPEGEDICFAPAVCGIIRENQPDSFVAAALAIEKSQADIVWLQHEFGLYGGPAGDNILELINAVSAPLMVTLHTVLEDPDPDQRRVMERIVDRASKIVVMSETACEQLRRVYGASETQVALIEHGVPDRPFGRGEQFKNKYDANGNNVLMTFGLLSPGKGIEAVIEAMPAVINQHPETLYFVVGATHPNLIAQQGESYRERLQTIAERLGVGDRIRWVNEFLEIDELLEMIEMADIYVTPYLGAGQATSGTLSYALALGKAVISTPYTHAKELLSEGHGVLVPFNDAGAIAGTVNHLLDHPEEMAQLRSRAYAKGRRMIWPEFAAKSMESILDIKNGARCKVPHIGTAPPSFSGVVRLTDATGILQHSCFSVPDRAHGYCIDDNARALLLMNRIGRPNMAEADRLAHIYAAFLQHAWNPDTKRFRNFMGFARNWLEDVGSEDSNGRTLWTLGATVAEARPDGLARWATRLFNDAAELTFTFQSPRAIAFAALGAVSVLGKNPAHQAAGRIAVFAAERLVRRLKASSRSGWMWFEPVLAYDNCRLPEALIRIGTLRDNQELIAQGMDALNWITALQQSPRGDFRPVGSDSFGRIEALPLPFDQQPVEAWAMIDAAAAAFEATRDDRWLAVASNAHAWFFGKNDRNRPLVNSALGTCHDGLNAQGINRNEGAESMLAFQLGDLAWRALHADHARCDYQEVAANDRIVA